MRSFLLLVMLSIAIAAGGWADEPQPVPAKAEPAKDDAKKADAAPKVLTADKDGTILLHARDATIHGKTVRYEPQPNKNTIGYWTKQEDWVSWDFEVPAAGEYQVVILQGCGKGSGGAKVDFAVDEQKMQIEVQDTGHFQNFVEREIGTLKFDKPGVRTFSVKPRSKPGVAVMDLRQVILKPVAK